MKPLIENPIIQTESYLKILIEFHKIINIILYSDNEEQLRFKMENTPLKYFKYGYGHNHFWLHQQENGLFVSNRILIITF